jgi:hypothetical protein
MLFLSNFFSRTPPRFVSFIMSLLLRNFYVKYIFIKMLSSSHTHLKAHKHGSRRIRDVNSWLSSLLYGIHLRQREICEHGEIANSLSFLSLDIDTQMACLIPFSIFIINIHKFSSLLSAIFLCSLPCVDRHMLQLLY